MNARTRVVALLLCTERKSQAALRHNVVPRRVSRFVFGFRVLCSYQYIRIRVFDATRLR